MQIESIYLENFRPFKDLRIKFNSNLNVIIGLNGAGKTAILDGIAFALVPMLAKLMDNKWHSNIKKLSIKETDIHYGENEFVIQISLTDNSNTLFNWKIGKRIQPFKSLSNFDNLLNYTKQIEKKLEEDPSINLPIIVYYSSSRINFDINFIKPFKNNHYKYNQLSIYENALQSGLDNFNSFLNWFTEEEWYEDKMRLEKDTNYRNPKLQVIRTTIEVFLSFFETNRNDFKNLRIKKERSNNGNSIITSLIISKNNIDFQLEQLSSGEKMMIMLIVDIARRISIANPSLTNPLLGEGIILIDEIDLHLHPQWQREIIPALNNTFPNCQFIVTTHSPQVLSRLKKENILIIEDDKIVKNPPHTYGKDTNSILFEIFNTLERPKHIQEKFDTCYKLIELEKFDKAKEILTDLSNELDEEDSDIIKVKSLLTFYEQ